ncbi:hypothetical protein PsorP6_008118 [Peronosclerospora sorghi]|uniref:Uncharacterized protein n=1 Tax=Peronosclerospora sorghi TaxID=230839 RepID=A0ACC0W6V1_9STRA|nr:hypothetical protein PsorP6_008118 [Peronosclerospora sorghi]
MFPRTALLSLGVSGLLGSRRFAAATTFTNVKRVNESRRENALCYVPSGSDGSFYIEQLKGFYLFLELATGINEHWRSVVAGQKFEKTDLIASVFGTLYSKPTRFTVQISPDKHMAFTGGLEFLNHSCNPNTRIDVSEHEAKVSFVAIKSIQHGEPLSFDYSTSEWDMDEKFECHCGAPTCQGHVGGAKYLSEDEVLARLPYFTPSILRQLLARKLTN